MTNIVTQQQIDYTQLFLLIPEKENINFITIDGNGEVWGFTTKPYYEASREVWDTNVAGDLVNLGMSFLYNNAPNPNRSLIERCD